MHEVIERLTLMGECWSSCTHCPTIRWGYLIILHSWHDTPSWYFSDWIALYTYTSYWQITVSFMYHLIYRENVCPSCLPITWRISSETSSVMALSPLLSVIFICSSQFYRPYARSVTGLMTVMVTGTSCVDNTLSSLARCHHCPTHDLSCLRHLITISRTSDLGLLGCILR